MADTLPDLVARLKAAVPALADVPVDVLAAEVVRQLQARGGPSVGETLGAEPDAPVFRTSNEKDASGAAVVRAAPSPWTKAATIGAAPADVNRSALRVALGEIQAPWRAATVGAAPRSEQLGNTEHALWSWLGGTLPGTVGDALGVTQFRGKAQELEHPAPITASILQDVPGATSVGEVLAGERGLYSRVDDAVSRLPKNGAHPNKIATLLKSNGATAEELAYRQVPEFLASKGHATVTPGELQAHLAAHPAPMPAVKTRGGGSSAFRVVPTSEVATPAGLDFPPYAVVNAEGAPLSYHQTAQAAQEGIAELPAMGTHGSGPPTKFDQYQLPGGEAYQETLLTLPPQPKPNQAALEAEIKAGQVRLQDLYQQAEGLSRRGPDALKPVWAEIEDLQAHHRDLMREMSQDPPGQYRSSHFDEPNIVVHTRSNTRTLPTGERGRFVEEVQSDWHQAGKEKGYQGHVPAPKPFDATGWSATTTDTGSIVKDLQGEEIGRVLRGRHDGGGAQTAGEAIDRVVERRVAEIGRQSRAVPDAPFKETWPDLGLKQQLLEAAKDPDAQWLGFTSGQTQAARYDLSKQIDELKWYKHGDGYRIKAFKGGVAPLIEKQGLSESELAATVGKEMARKIVANTEQHGVMSGLDLNVGGEGMHHFYDELLPKRLQKIVKPFGGTVERSSVSHGGAHLDLTYQGPGVPPVVPDAPAPAWIVRLTPAMKARILKEGLPLGLLLGAAGPSVIEALGGDRTSPQ